MPRKKDAPPTTAPTDRPGLDLLRRAEEGDAEAAKLVREGLSRESLARIGSLVHNAEHSIIDRMMGKNLLARDSASAQLAVLKADLCGPDPSPLERLLVDRIALTWLQLQYFETVYTQSLGELTIAQADSQQRRIDAAHRRYLSAIRTLAQVRRLAVPMMQVNIAERQVNVAQPAPKV